MGESEKAKNVVRRNIERWTRQYSSDNPHAWGMDASPAARFLLNTRAYKSKLESNAKLDLLEIGAGYGRDTKLFTDLGHYVVAFEFAVGALNSAPQTLRDRIHSNLTWIVADFVGYKGLGYGIFDVVFSHRTLHLLTEQSMVNAFKSEVVRVTKSGGIVCISARDTRDFNPEQMVWVDEEKGIAEYTLAGREGHVISFWSAERFKQEFGELLYIVSITLDSEPESVTNANTNSYFTTMFGIRL